MRAVVAAAVSGSVALLALWLWSASDDPNPARSQTLADATAHPAAAAARSFAALSAAAPSASAPRAPEAFERWMTESSSLRGVMLDGAWDVDAQGELHPTMALRRRFDQLLTLLGEATIGEITAYVAYDVEGLAGPLAAQRVLDAWQRYCDLQQHAYSVQPDPRDRASLAAALTEHQQVRRRILGTELAGVFFADEEQRLQALLQGRAAEAPAALTLDRAALSPAALERLKQTEAAWADWERRLADARREQESLAQRAELSPAQREEAMARYIAQRFDAGEAMRVRGLIATPAPGGS